MDIVEITPDLREDYNLKLQNFEKIFSYPLGQDHFYIDHGDNYYSFFDRLGKPHIYVGLSDSQEIVAVSVAVLRDIDLRGKGKVEKVWYLCDLKVHPDFRGIKFIRQVIDRAFIEYSSLSNQIYGITMNPGIGNNRVVPFASRLSKLGLRFSGDLSFYILDETQKDMARLLIEKHFGPYHFMSLRGQKDLILESTGLPLPFVHYATKSNPQFFMTQQEDCQFMFCFPSSHPIVDEMKGIGMFPNSSASILSNMDNVDWTFIKSCDI